MTFSQHGGVPSILKSGKSSPFNIREFTDLLNRFNIKHQKSTLLWPQANGAIEWFMSTLKWVVQLAELEGMDLKWALYPALRSYCFTPDSTTGESPATLLFERALETKIPQWTTSGTIDPDEICVTYTSHKCKMKANAYKRWCTWDTVFMKGNRVIFMQKQTRKTDAPFDAEPLRVVASKGHMVMAQLSGKFITRDLSHFKHLPRCPPAPYLMG